MKRVLVDTCVWYAIFDPRDRPHDRLGVSALNEKIGYMTAVIPWPITYETVSSRFAKNRQALEGFERLLKSHRVHFLDDAGFRDDALEHSFASSLRAKPVRPLSLTDCLLRVILSSPVTNIDCLATYNVRDFHDVCEHRRIELLS